MSAQDQEQEPYRQRTYFALALDPIYVGTGGYRLGEVDLTIVREPGTNLPKIPGSSLAGSARAYTAMAKGKYRWEDTDNNGKTVYRSCAGKGGEEGAEHCGKIDCPVCVTYGFTIGPQNRSFHGLAQFYDMQVLFFPVHTMVGPVWVTSPGALEAAGYELPKDKEPPKGKVRIAKDLVEKPQNGRRWGLNLGWLFLEIAGDDLDTEGMWQQLKLPAKLKERLVLAPDELFTIIVNGNLEVRTSVSIAPSTGAAEEGALFTYEALPRSTVLFFNVVFHNPRHYLFPKWENDQPEPEPFPENINIDWVKENVEVGLRLLKHLGIGGMNTRGFGRLDVFDLSSPPAPKEGQDG